MKKKTSMNVTPVVSEIGKIHFSGNIIPMSWYKHITRPTRKIGGADASARPVPDLVAISILGDIIYWYRPYEVRDEVTGAIKGYRRKFEGDKLQRSNVQYQNLFGLTRQQVRDSLDRLRELGIITTELRNYKLENGTHLSNVMFVEPVPEKVREITHDLLDYIEGGGWFYRTDPWFCRTNIY